MARATGEGVRRESEARGESGRRGRDRGIKMSSSIDARRWRLELWSVPQEPIHSQEASSTGGDGEGGASGWFCASPVHLILHPIYSHHSNFNRVVHKSVVVHTDLSHLIYGTTLMKFIIRLGF